MLTLPLIFLNKKINIRYFLKLTACAELIFIQLCKCQQNAPHYFDKASVDFSFRNSKEQKGVILTLLMSSLAAFSKDGLIVTSVKTLDSATHQRSTSAP